MKPVSEQSREEWLADYDKPTTRNAVARHTSNPQSRITHPGTAQRQTTKKQIIPKIVPPENLPTVIHEGMYTAKCCHFQFREFWSTSKLTLIFEISVGRYAGIRLECFYNLDKKKNTDCEFVPKQRSFYFRVMSEMFATIKAAGGDWLAPENLLGKLFRIEVITVTKDHAKKSLGCNQYSKVKPNIELIKE